MVSKVKREPNLTSPLWGGLGSIKTEPGTAESVAGSNVKPDIEPLIPEPNWKTCDNEDRYKRVIIKEQAARNAAAALKKMQATLKLHILANPSCQTRIDKIDEILARKKEFQVTVGCLGSTGAGKSTLLNALVGCKDLLPSSSWRASTAVCTELRYNKSMDRDKAFRAEVVYITPAEWREELQSIFEDLEQASTKKGDDEIDEEQKERIKQSIDKIKCVYPHINTRLKLESTSIDSLLESPEVCNVLGSTRTIEKRTRAQLSYAIRPCIDSGDISGSSHWPIVKLVRIFVKSSILAPGIILVDLPGNSDSNSARSVIAEKYAKDLSVSVVVANITRGISEKNAAELLEKFTKRGLQLDGLYNADSLCFVLSQTDRDFDMKQYVRQYPDLAKDVAVDSKCIWQLQGSIAELERERNVAEKTQKKNSKSLKELSSEIKKLTSNLNALSSPSEPLPLTRKRGVDDTDDTELAEASSPASPEQFELRKQLLELQKQLSDLQAMIHSGDKDLASYGRRIAYKRKALFYANSRFQVQCIRHRNEQSSSAIRKDYLATLQEMGRQPSKDLQVFPVSASIHLKYQNPHNSEKRHPGFPNMEDTQVSALREWLIGTTLVDRERIVQSFLDDVDAFLASVQPWIMNKFGEIKMSADLRAQWEPRMESLVADLEADLRSLTIKTEATMKHLVQSNIYSVFPQAEKLAAAKAKSTAEKWAMTTHWSTHRKINSKKGLWTDYKGRVHKWNDDLVHDFTSHILRSWDFTFYKQFPQEKVKYFEAVKALISDLAQVIATKDVFPDASDGIDVLKDHILRTQNRLLSDTDTAFDEMKKIIKKAHRMAIPTVMGFLEPMYKHCASESGTGLYRRNRRYIEKFMTNKGVQMHQAGKNAIKNEIDQLLDNVPTRLGQGNAIILQFIRHEVKLFFDRNSSGGSRLSTRKAVSNAKVLMQKDMLADIAALAVEWKKEVEVEEIPDDDETEDEMTFNDDRFVDLSKDVDDDDEYADSDGEAI